MSRSARQTKILELISKKNIETQEDLANELRSAKYNVTQATVSRDIKELSLIKILGENKRYKYAVEKSASSGPSVKLINMFRDAVLSVTGAGNMIVIKTLMGSAGAACMLIDKLNFPSVLGSMAGEDTVFAVATSEAEARDVITRLNEIIIG